MGKYEILFLTIMVASLLMVALGVAIQLTSRRSAVRFGGRYDIKTSKDSREERSRLGGASQEPTAKGD